MSEETRSERWTRQMLAAQAGDAFAYRQVLAELAPFLRAMAQAALRRSGHGLTEAEDIVQEVLLAIHLKRGNWDQTQPFAPWVSGIARFKIIDALRRRGRRAESDIDDFIEILPMAASDPDAGSDIERLLGQIGERPAQIVRAIALDERSAGDVAASLGMSEGAVRVALHRALKQLATLVRRGEA